MAATKRVGVCARAGFACVTEAMAASGTCPHASMSAKRLQNQWINVNEWKGPPQNSKTERYSTVATKVTSGADSCALHLIHRNNECIGALSYAEQCVDNTRFSLALSVNNPCRWYP